MPQSLQRLNRFTLNRTRGATNYNANVYIKYIDGLVQDCSISSANALEILQPCTKPSMLVKNTPHSSTVGVRYGIYCCEYKTWPMFNLLSSLQCCKAIYRESAVIHYDEISSPHNGALYLYTVRCRYNAVNFLTNSHKRHPIARPLGLGMGCPLSILHLIYILPQFL